MWHGQTCYISQIKTKRVGAWPLWIFSMVAQIFNVFKFIFAKSSRRKIFFCWGHTNTLGTFLRRSPPQWLMSSSDYKSYLWRGYELHIGNDQSGSIGFQCSLNFLRLDLMNAGYQNIFNWMDDCHIPDVQQERWCRICCSRSWAVGQWWSKDRWQQLSSLWKSNLSTASKFSHSIPGGRRREATNMGKDFP